MSLNYGRASREFVRHFSIEFRSKASNSNRDVCVLFQIGANLTLGTCFSCNYHFSFPDRSHVPGHLFCGSSRHRPLHSFLLESQLGWLFWTLSENYSWGFNCVQWNFFQLLTGSRLKRENLAGNVGEIYEWMLISELSQT